MRDSSNERTAADAARGDPTAAEMDPRTSPPPALTYGDESPDTRRREPSGGQSAAAVVKAAAAEALPGSVFARLRSRLLERARRIAGDTGEWLGQMLGQFVEVATVFEQDAGALRERAEDRLTTLSTRASHAEQLQAGALGSRLEDLRERVPQGRARRVVVVKWPAVAALAATLGLGAAAGMWLLRGRRAASVPRARDSAAAAARAVTAWDTAPPAEARNTRG